MLSPGDEAVVAVNTGDQFANRQGDLINIFLRLDPLRRGMSLRHNHVIWSRRSNVLVRPDLI